MRKFLLTLLVAMVLTSSASACNWNFVVYSGGMRSYWSQVYGAYLNQLTANNTPSAEAKAGDYLLAQQQQFCSWMDAKAISVTKDYSPVRCTPNVAKDLAGNKGTLCEVFTNNTPSGQYGPSHLVTWWQ